MHSKCLTGDVFGSARCDCGWQLHSAMRMIAEQGAGVVVYLDQEGRGIGLLNKLKAYELQDEGHDTVEANEKIGFKPDLRNCGIGAQILLDLGLSSIRVLTNNPMKLIGLERYGLETVERLLVGSPPSAAERACPVATRGLGNVALAHRIAVGFGVLATETETQALARVDKGAEAVQAALETAAALERLGAAPRD